ncbi:MAG: hypothetical protein ABL864_02490 [Terricaulis sp.]
MSMRPPKKKTAKAKANPSPKDARAQRERFEEAAKTAGGVDADAFERAMGKIAPAKRPSAKA